MWLLLLLIIEVILWSYYSTSTKSDKFFEYIIILKEQTANLVTWLLKNMQKDNLNDDNVTEDEIRTTRIRETIPDRVKTYVWNRDGGRCVNCSSNQKLEYDHIIPISKGGSNTERNIQLLCQDCNRSKGANITIDSNQ